MATTVPIMKNQTAKNNESLPLAKVVAKSCISPQKMKVNMSAIPIGNIFLSGLNIFAPK